MRSSAAIRCPNVPILLSMCKNRRIRANGLPRFFLTFACCGSPLFYGITFPFPLA